MNRFNELLNEHQKKLDLYVPVVERVHGAAHPEFHDVKRVYDQLRDKLAQSADITHEFSELRRITFDYSVPSDVCESYQAVYEMLRDLDEAYTA